MHCEGSGHAKMRQASPSLTVPGHLFSLRPSLASVLSFRPSFLASLEFLGLFLVIASFSRPSHQATNTPAAARSARHPPPGSPSFSSTSLPSSSQQTPSNRHSSSPKATRLDRPAPSKSLPTLVPFSWPTTFHSSEFRPHRSPASTNPALRSGWVGKLAQTRFPANTGRLPRSPSTILETSSLRFGRWPQPSDSNQEAKVRMPEPDRKRRKLERISFSLLSLEAAHSIPLNSVRLLNFGVLGQSDRVLCDPPPERTAPIFR